MLDDLAFIEVNRALFFRGRHQRNALRGGHHDMLVAKFGSLEIFEDVIDLLLRKEVVEADVLNLAYALPLFVHDNSGFVVFEDVLFQLQLSELSLLGLVTIV